MEVGGNTSPKYRRRYRIMNNFDGLSVDQIVPVFPDDWILSVPFFEVNVNVVVCHFVCSIWIEIAVLIWSDSSVAGAGGICRGCRGCRGGSFPFWQCKLARFDDNFIYLTQSSFSNDRCQLMMSYFS